MSRAFRWLVVTALCCAAGAAPGQEQKDTQLVKAQRAFDEANRLKDAGKYTEAVPQAEQALRWRESVLGVTHPEVASCLRLLGILFLRLDDTARAELHLQRALAIQEAVLGKSHPDLAMSLNIIASLYKEQGMYTRAELLYQRALAIREAALGKHHPDVAVTLHNLASLYRAQGMSFRAEPLEERALAIWEADLGKQPPERAMTFVSLAAIYSAQGMYSRAELLYERALAMEEAALGGHHPNVAFLLSMLARTYRAQGMYARAEVLEERELAIWEDELGKHDSDGTAELINAAGNYRNQGMYSRAEVLYERALAIEEAALGKHHPGLAGSLSNLANVYRAQGMYARAKPLYERALAMEEATRGKHHPDVAATLYNLAILYHEQGMYAQAEPIYERALDIWEAALGKNHSYVSLVLTRLAHLHLAQRRITNAMPLLERSFALSEQRLRHDALGFSEARLSSFLEFLREDEECLYSLLRQYPEDASVQRLALAAALLRKGRSTEEIAATSRTIYRSLAAQDRATFERLRELRTQMAKLSLDGPGPHFPSDYQQRLQALSAEDDRIEAELAKRSAPLRALTALPGPAEIVDRVAASLPPNSALVEFVAYADRPLASKILVPKSRTPASKFPSELRYLALVLFPDARIQALDLGPAAPIDRAGSNLRDALASRDAVVERPAQALYSLAFQPLLPQLGNVRRLYLAPDGQLGLIPFAALHDGKKFLVDSFDLSYLNSGKELVPRAQEVSPATSVVVLADPAFSVTPSVAASTSPVGAPSTTERAPVLERFFSTLRYGLAQQPWTPLPGTRQEARAIHRLLPQAQLFLGPEATKQRLLRLATPGVLHVATHGFFLEKDTSPSSSRAIGQFGGFGSNAPAHLLPDPLLRSGLVLTGARALAADDPTAKVQAESSLVTALELAGLDLWGTQLVVLSACDTGRGDVKLGQGVYGLRRAFTVAGAETVVMSLWKVNDDSTSALMEDYYRNLLVGKGRAEALRDAARTLRETRPHPYYWAPFITLGKDTPLRLQAPTLQEEARLFPLPRNASPVPR